MSIGALFATFILLAVIIGLCALAWWVVTTLSAPAMIQKIALVVIVLCGVAALIFVVLPRLGVPIH